MKDYDSGVKWYTKGKLPTVFFPEDDVCCERCQYFKRYEGRCYITGEVVPLPKTNIGRICPILEFDDNDREKDLRNE